MNNDDNNWKFASTEDLSSDRQYRAIVCHIAINLCVLFYLCRGVREYACGNVCKCVCEYAKYVYAAEMITFGSKHKLSLVAIRITPAHYCQHFRSWLCECVLPLDCIDTMAGQSTFRFHFVLMWLNESHVPYSRWPKPMDVDWLKASIHDAFVSFIRMNFRFYLNRKKMKSEGSRLRLCFIQSKAIYPIKNHIYFPSISVFATDHHHLTFGAHTDTSTHTHNPSHLNPQEIVGPFCAKCLGLQSI